ncbi:hypothetical protein D3C81_1759600 [compost metagenome]
MVGVGHLDIAQLAVHPFHGGVQSQIGARRVIDGNQGIAAPVHDDGWLAIQFAAGRDLGHACPHAHALRGQCPLQVGAADGVAPRRQAAQAQEAVERLVRQAV